MHALIFSWKDSPLMGAGPHPRACHDGFCSFLCGMEAKLFCENTYLAGSGYQLVEKKHELKLPPNVDLVAYFWLKYPFKLIKILFV